MTARPTVSDHQPYTIVAALAFDQTGEEALREAARLALLHQATELHLVHVVYEAALGSALELVSVEQRLARAPQEIDRYVERVLSDRALKVVAHVRTGIPARAIVQTAVSLNADMLVVGSHRRSGLPKLVLGSVAEQVLRQAHCPVLIALTKDSAGSSADDSIEPPCPDCVAQRQRTQGAQYWCDRHSHSYMKPHVYEPSHRSRTTVMPSL